MSMAGTRVGPSAVELRRRPSLVWTLKDKYNQNKWIHLATTFWVHIMLAAMLSDEKHPTPLNTPNPSNQLTPQECKVKGQGLQSRMQRLWRRAEPPTGPWHTCLSDLGYLASFLRCLQLMQSHCVYGLNPKRLQQPWW